MKDMNGEQPSRQNPLPIHKKFSQEANERAKEIKMLHELVRERIIKANEKLKLCMDTKKKDVQFKQGNLVWIHLREERFLSRRSKISQSDGPFKVLENVNNKSYKIELPGDYGVSQHSM